MRELNPEWRPMGESEAPETLKETITPGPMQPESKETQPGGRRRADIETLDRPEPEFDNPWILLPFAEATWRPTYQVRGVTSAEDVETRVQEVLDLPVLNLAAVQGKDPDLVSMKELLQEHDVRPRWNAVREESAEVKILWTQFHRLKVQENVLYRRRKEAAADPRWQVVAPKPLRSQIFKACHHHAMAAHQGVVRTAALIKRRFYWPRMQKDVEAWCKRCTTCGSCKATVRGHGELQQPWHSAFNERVSVDLIGPLYRTDRGNEYIVVMQDHFTKWVEGAAVATKAVMLVADVIVHERVYKHDTPLNLHSDRGTEFTAAMHRCLCDLLRIHKTYNMAYNPQSNGAVERCNRTLLSMLRTVVSEQQNDWDDHLPAALCAYRSTPHASTGVSPHKIVYGVEMTLHLDLMLGDTGPEQPEQECPYEYVEWRKDSLRRAHSRARKTLKTAVKRQRRGYGEPNRIVRFHRGEWVWRAYPRQGGKLRYTNRRPWLVLAKTGPVTYKIQRHPQADLEIVHVDKLILENSCIPG